MIRGRVIVLFYESRHEIRKNIELKNELKGLYRAQPEDIKQEIFRLVVIDCSTAVWPTTPIWKSKLNEHSRKEGFTIYGMILDECLPKKDLGTEERGLPCPGGCGS